MNDLIDGLSPQRLAARLSRSNRLAHGLGLAAHGLHLATLSLRAPLDLAIRLWLAQIFWVSGLLKASNWDTALALATHEYPVTWLDPVSAAWLGAAIELICPVFLALGLATRFAALPLLILSLIIQLEYQALNSHLFWAMLLGWYVVRGAGALSLDRLLGAGIASTALPFATGLGRMLETLSYFGDPLYRLLLRLGLALMLLLPGSGLVDAGARGPFAYRWQIPLLPADSAEWSQWLLALLVPALLATGLATRFAATLGLLILAGTAMAMDMTVLQRIDYVYWSLLLALLLVHGAGPLALDHWLGRQLRRRLPQLDGHPATPLEQLPQVVIVGAGFGGLAAARALRFAPCRVTLVDRHNYHLFQPLLYQVATASLSPADIASPIRELFREQFNARVLLGTVTGIDTASRQVLLGERRLPYDYLILATGARHAYFGREEWETLAPGLKQIDDATHIRRRLLLAFEQAEDAEDAEEQRRLLTFVIVGGGPTGVELAGAIAELARHGMAREFRNIDPASAQVLLIQSGPRILPTFPETLSHRAAESLRQLGVEVLTDSRVEQVDAAGVLVSGRRIPAQTVFWAAGVVASPAGEWLAAECDPARRLKVGPDLSVPGLPEVFAIGDTALSTGWDGKPVPGLAPAAKQGGKYVAKIIRARLEGRPDPAPFRYRHPGSLATIGRQAAVADFGRLRLSGAPAWWLWGAVHVMFLAGLRSRILVAVQWAWAYLTFRRGTRLITGDATDRPPATTVAEPELKLVRGMQ